MAGIVPLQNSKSGRKQWTLHDGSRSSLRRLRSQLAEDGCPESQVVLAKELLEERCELDMDKEENAKLGVYWLTKASEQGNEEATEILRQCLKSGRGITEHNCYDVKACLDMSQDEKLARRAARELFQSLSNGEDFITTEQLQRRMRSLSSSSSTSLDKHRNSKSFLKDSIDESTEEDLTPDREEAEIPEKNEEFEKIRQGEKISEAALVSAAASYAHGLLPIVSRAVCLVDKSQMELDAIPILQRPFLHPLVFLRSFYIWLVQTIGNFGLSLRNISNLQFLLLLLVYALFGTENLILFVPIALYYLSFVIMIISTFQMLQKNRELTDFRIWSGLFLSYSGGNLHPEEAEYQFCRKNMRPYALFFLALLVYLMSYPLIAHQWTPQDEFTIIAVALTTVTTINFAARKSKFPDFLALFSFGINVLAKYPYETDHVVTQGWRFLDIRMPTFASYVVGNGIEFCLNFRVIFYLLIPTILLKMAARDSWKGTYKYLIPHCVTLSWWQIAIFSSQGATWYGLIRGTLALVGLVLFLPIISLASILLPILAATKYLTENGSSLLMNSRVFVAAFLGGVPFLASWYLRKVRVPRFNWIITTLQVVFGVTAAFFLFWPAIEDYSQGSYQIGEIDSMTWEQYHNHCHQPTLEATSSKAQIQVECAHFEGMTINWDGYVTNAKLKSIRNPIKTISSYLPSSLEAKLSCMFGTAYKSNECSEKSTYSEEPLKNNCLHEKVRKCDLSGWNSYEFEISVKMKSGIWSNAEIVLVADHSFANCALNIFTGDKVSFFGKLMNSGLEGEALLGGSRPRVALEQISCQTCHQIDLQPCKRRNLQFQLKSIADALLLGSKIVLNFVLNPLVIFK